MEPKINTTQRWNAYCRAKAEDGRVCSLYSDHFGKHKKLGDDIEGWEDGE